MRWTAGGDVVWAAGRWTRRWRVLQREILHAEGRGEVLGYFHGEGWMGGLDGETRLRIDWEREYEARDVGVRGKGKARGAEK